MTKPNLLLPELLSDPVPGCRKVEGLGRTLLVEREEE